MTGYNHYPSCSCGWCTGGGGGQVYLSIADAARGRLKYHGVSGFTSCFVNPNARCPVCGQSVFFYANSYGSRVYFDDLGPPWPKHRCTDTTHHSGSGQFKGPTRRSTNEIKEILSADRDAGTSYAIARNKVASEWVLYVVVEAVYEKGVLWISTESVSAPERTRANFSIHCADRILDGGDLISSRGNIFSFVRRDTLDHIEVTDGQDVGKVEEIEEEGIDPNEIPNSKDDLRASERRHFHSAALSLTELVGKYKVTLFDLAKRNIVGPKLVSHYLNASGRRTAIGAPWTPRLAYFLISMTKAPTEKTLRPSKPVVRPRKASHKTPRNERGKLNKSKELTNATGGKTASKTAPVDPIEIVDLPKLQQEIERLDALMTQLSDEREWSWISEKKRHAVTERYHSVKKKRDQLWLRIERLK